MRAAPLVQLHGRATWDTRVDEERELGSGHYGTVTLVGVKSADGTEGSGVWSDAIEGLLVKHSKGKEEELPRYELSSVPFEECKP